MLHEVLLGLQGHFGPLFSQQPDDIEHGVANMKISSEASFLSVSEKTSLERIAQLGSCHKRLATFARIYADPFSFGQ